MVWSQPQAQAQTQSPAQPWHLLHQRRAAGRPAAVLSGPVYSMLQSDDKWGRASICWAAASLDAAQSILLLGAQSLPACRRQAAPHWWGGGGGTGCGSEPRQLLLRASEAPDGRTAHVHLSVVTTTEARKGRSGAHLSQQLPGRCHRDLLCIGQHSPRAGCAGLQHHRHVLVAGAGY